AHARRTAPTEQIALAECLGWWDRAVAARSLRQTRASAEPPRMPAAGRADAPRAQRQPAHWPAVLAPGCVSPPPPPLPARHRPPPCPFPPIGQTVALAVAPGASPTRGGLARRAARRRGGHAAEGFQAANPAPAGARQVGREHRARGSVDAWPLPIPVR